MNETPSEPDDPQVQLSETEEKQVEARKATASRVVHEVIRRQGDDELDRPAVSLMWSGLVGGIAISASLLGKSLFESHLPDAAWRPAVSSLGYALGFLVVILGRLQLFTESTLSAVIPVATKLTGGNLVRLLRLWSIVFLANMAGTLLVAWLSYGQWIGTPETSAAMLETAREALKLQGWAGVRAGVPAGFLIAAVAWSLPAGRRQEFWIVLFFTYFISLGGFAHVVAGSCEAWLLWVAGQVALGDAVGGMILPALLGNVLGGTMMFALLAHAQVRQEL
jgi:formate/nitrite transporter FocA (FNT family)